MAPSEANVSAPFGKVDPSDQFPAWIENGDSIKAFRPHAPPDPEVSIDIHAKSIRGSIVSGGDERLCIR